MKKEPLRLLLVDDDELTLKLLRHHIQSHFGQELRITATTHPGEALSILAKEGFDICITDLDMPGLNGFNLLKTIKATNVLTDVIILTCYPSSSAIRSAFAMGANDYLVKPIQIKDEIIIRTLRFYIERVERLAREILEDSVEPQMA
ncbi:MAG: response regulator [Planctomycetota bacterium]|nr:response regulator [Planctomycetota bacterium]